MMSEPLGWWWGMKLSDELDLRSGTIYPLLARLEKAGWLESSWEDVDPAEKGRPRRRLYKLTGHGERVALSELSELGIGIAGAPAEARRQREVGQPRVRWS